MAASDALSPSQKLQAYKRWKMTGHPAFGMYFSTGFGGGQPGSYWDYDDDYGDDGSGDGGDDGGGD